MAKITVQNTEITVTNVNGEDYICITDMLKAKDGDFFVADWLRNRNTMEFLGVWERIYNPNFNYGEFATIRNQAELKGNIRDYATINELICLSNMENVFDKREQSQICLSFAERRKGRTKFNINAVLINDGMPQGERLVKLNQIAIQQMQVLEGNSGRNLLK